MLRPDIVVDMLANFTAYATDQKKRRIKIVARFQQYEGTNKIVERVVAGYPKKGLLWHFQGSGKSLLMLFAARKLRLHPALKNPTVMIVVDRIDLDTQISSTFYAADTPNLTGPHGQTGARRTCGSFWHRRAPTALSWTEALAKERFASGRNGRQSRRASLSERAGPTGFRTFCIARFSHRGTSDRGCLRTPIRSCLATASATRFVHSRVSRRRSSIRSIAGQ